MLTRNRRTDPQHTYGSMSFLNDLPPEWPIQILEDVGGRELRRGKDAARLVSASNGLSQHAQAIVHRSGLKTRTVNLHGHDIEELDHACSYSRLRTLMHKNTRGLRIRLLGHCWDEHTAHAENAASDSDYDVTTCASMAGRSQAEVFGRQAARTGNLDKPFRCVRGVSSSVAWQAIGRRPAGACFTIVS